MNLPAKIYTEKELQKARERGKMVGWVQGGGAVVLGGIALRLLGWIPAILVVGFVIWVLYKLVSNSDDEPAKG
jgi:hypothetical protein